MQMPPGSGSGMGIGQAGAKNAAVLAVRILALSNPELSEKLVAFRQDMVKEVEEKARRIIG
jgi:phosphoribosylcarboxyaminoimidazole (NCAIR) mutase